MRIVLHIDPVLDRAGLALVRVDRHQPGAGLGSDEAPFASGREARAALSFQAAVLQRTDHVVHPPRARQALLENLVAAARDIVVEIDMSGNDGRMVRPFNAGEDRFHGRLGHMAMTDLGHRSLLAAAHAGCPHDPHVVSHGLGQRFQQTRSTNAFAREAVADPDRQRRRRALALHHHVEVRVERRDLVDLGHGETHLGRERREMTSREAAIMVLNRVQMLDQQVAAPGLVAQQRAHLFSRRRIDLATFFGIARPAPPATGVSGCLTSARKSHLRLRPCCFSEIRAHCGKLVTDP